MAGYKIQLKDKNGNRQYPVSTVDVVVDADGVSVADLLDRKQPTLVSGVNIKTINGKTLLGEGDLVIEGGTADLSGYATEEYVDAKVGESYPIYYPLNGEELTEEQKAVNKMAYDAVVAASGADSPQMPYLYPYDFGRQFPFMVFDFSVDGGYVEILLNADLTPVPLSDYSLPILSTGLVTMSEGLKLYADGSVTFEYGDTFITPSVGALMELAQKGGGSNTTETDPVFKASPAAAITQADITRWNSNTGGGGSVTVDSAMSDTSTNPVQNKTVKAYVDSKTATAGQMPVNARVENVYELTPNILHRWSGEQTSLTITLKSVSSAYVQHYMMQFTTSSSGCTLSLPSTIKWQSGLAPVLKPSTTYMISIVNDLGVWSYYE